MMIKREIAEMIVLLIDDDKEALKINKKYLEKRGFEVGLCEDGSSAVEFLKNNRVDCIVLDIMMPGQDGFEIFPELRKLSDAPVLFLSARGEDADRIRGLSLGADDYISKPCSLEELALRIEINIRKSRPKEGALGELEIPPLKIMALERKVYYGEKEVLLSNREYELLLLFAKNENRVLTFEEIGIAVNGSYLVSDRQAVMMTVSRLRKKLDQYAGISNMIETVWGEGYVLRS
ncbi:MAG: response regulator transcription factor [Parasporobacterium sp.]|nr:response regulator transcription factor [Parasporobacterium sp.]